MISKQTNTFKFNKVQSLKIKFPFYITILCVLISAVLAFVFTQKNLISLKTEYEKRSNSIALNLSNEIKYGLLTEDTEVISQVILPQLKQPDIIYIVVVNNKGEKLVAEYKEALDKNIDNQLNKWALSVEKLSISYTNEMFSHRNKTKNSFIEAAAPVYGNIESFDLDDTEQLSEEDRKAVNIEKLGVIRVGLSLSSLKTKRFDMIKFALIIGIAAAFFSYIIAYFLTRLLVKPIIDISYMASRVSNGQLDGMVINADQSKMSFNDTPITLELDKADELGFLTTSFIRMAKRIKEHNSELEAKVDQRTQELFRANKTLMLYRHSIEGTSDSVLIADSNGKILIVNHAFIEISGYNNEDLEGNIIEKVIAQHELPMFKEIVYSALDCEGKWEGKTFFCKKWGESYPVELSITTIVDEDQKPIANVLISRDITLRIRYEDELKKLANHDSLTGLFNRRRFQEELMLAIARCNRQQSKLAIFWIDLDQFKEINDTLGHQAGDSVLCNIANTLVSSSRHDEIVARMGGDEFAMITLVKSEEEAYLSAERIINRIRQSPIVVKNQHLSVTMSIGVALYPDHAKDIEDLVARADIALYTSKMAGRNCFNVYQPVDEGYTDVINNLELNKKTRDAIEHNKLIFYMQPIIETKTSNISHYELLLRMLDDNGKIISPEAFISQAERSGIIREIDHWVIVNAIKLLASAKENGHDISCAINLSAQSLNEDRLSSFIHDQLTLMDVLPQKLMLELTESAAISDFDKALHFIQTLSDIGCRFALDDFGSGFSSFAYLKKLPVNYLKLDGSYIHNLPNEPRDIFIVEGMVKVANGLGMKIIAEWVEDKETLDILTNLGVDLVQGFYTGKPLPVSTLFEGKLN